MTLDEVMAIVRELRSPGSFGPPPAGFLMHPKTYEAMQAHLREATDALPAFSVLLVLDSWVPVGLVLPVDHDGKPIPKSATDTKRVEGGT